jgi:hypothetical protein
MSRLDSASQIRRALARLPLDQAQAIAADYPPPPLPILFTAERVQGRGRRQELPPTVVELGHPGASWVGARVLLSYGDQVAAMVWEPSAEGGTMAVPYWAPGAAYSATSKTHVHGWLRGFGYDSTANGKDDRVRKVSEAELAEAIARGLAHLSRRAVTS